MLIILDKHQISTSHCSVHSTHSKVFKHIKTSIFESLPAKVNCTQHCVCSTILQRLTVTV